MNLANIRCLLYVPGDSPKKLAKASSVPVGGLIVDWEDAVSACDKHLARKYTIEGMPELFHPFRPLYVRINAADSTHFNLDCEALQGCKADGVAIPKCESVRTIETLLGSLPGGMSIMALIETPLGVLRAAELAGCSERVVALMFGAQDYSSAMQMRLTRNEREMLYARGHVVNAARSYSKEVFDSPQMNYRDISLIRESAEQSRSLGFTGQAAIHPAQLAVIHEVYLPTNEELAAARDILDRFEKHGLGVSSTEGVLEDEPTLKRARQIIAMHDIALRRG